MDHHIKHRAEEAQAAAALLKRQGIHTQRLLDLSQHLPEEDRALIKAIYERGMKPNDFARAIKISPRSMRYRLQSLMLRMRSPLYQYVIKHTGGWSQRRQTIANHVVLRGQSQRKTAQCLSLSVHRIRQELSRIRILCDQEGSG